VSPFLDKGFRYTAQVKKRTKKTHRTVIVLSRYDRSKHKERTATSFQMSVKKKSQPQLFGLLLIRKSVGGERRALIRMLLNTSNFLAFFQTENQYFCKTSLCWIVAGASLSSTIQNAHLFSPSNAFDTGIS